MKQCPNCEELVGDDVKECFNCHYNFIYKRVMNPNEVTAATGKRRKAERKGAAERSTAKKECPLRI